MSPYGLLADATVLLQLAYVAFVFLGGLWARSRAWIAWLHVPAVVWFAWVRLAGVTHLLTRLERWLRERGGDVADAPSWIERQVAPFLSPGSVPAEVDWGLGVLVLLLNASVYGWPRRGPVRRGA